METILDAAVDYSISQEERHITLEDLEKAFINGAKWMVEDKTEKKKQRTKSNEKR